MTRALLVAVLATAWAAAAGAQDASATWARERAREEAGDFKGAIEACQQILREHPQEKARALNAIGGLSGKMGRFREEIQWSQRALAADAHFFEAEINIGNAQAQLGQMKAAQASFERARTLAPREPLPAYSLGVLAEARHDVAGATALYEQSVALEPKFDSGWFNLAAMYASAGRFDDALGALDKVLALNPKAADALAMRRHVEADKAAAAKR